MVHKQKLKHETEVRKNWQDMAKKKEEEAAMFKEQVIKATQELQSEKMEHKKTQDGLALKVERLKIYEKEKKNWDKTGPNTHSKRRASK